MRWNGNIINVANLQVPTSHRWQPEPLMSEPPVKTRIIITIENESP